MNPLGALRPVLFASLVVLAACRPASSEEGSSEAALSSLTDSSCEAKVISRLANAFTVDELASAGLDRTAAEAVIAARPIESVKQLHDVPKVGEAGLSSLLAHGRERGLLARCPVGRDAEIGIIADVDRSANAPGLKALVDVLEHRGGKGLAGDVHFRTSRASRAGDVADIEGVLGAAGVQRFILVGQADRVDPEVYRDVVAAHADRIVGAFLVEPGLDVAARKGELHHQRNYAEVAGVLFKSGIITRAEARGVIDAARAGGLSLTPAENAALVTRGH